MSVVNENLEGNRRFLIARILFEIMSMAVK